MRLKLSLAGLAVLAVVLAIVLTGLLPSPSKTAYDLNLSLSDMPEWLMFPEGSVGENPTGLLDGSNRQFSQGSPGSGPSLIVHSMVFRFDSEVHARAYFDEVLQRFQYQGDPLEVPSNPPVGSASVWRDLADTLVFQEKAVVVSMYWSTSGMVYSFSKANLVDLARIIEARI